MHPDYLWTISTPTEAWNRVNDRIVNILGSCDVITNRRERYPDWESKIGDQKLELIGYLCVLTALMKVNNYPEDATKIQVLLDLVLPADLTDPDTFDAISKRHKELNPFESSQHG